MHRTKNQNFRSKISLTQQGFRSLHHEPDKHCKTESQRQEIIGTILKSLRPNIMDDVETEHQKIHQKQLIDDLEGSFEIEYYDKVPMKEVNSNTLNSVVSRRQSAVANITNSSAIARKQTITNQTPSSADEQPNHIDLVGEKAVSKYYHNYKHLTRITDQNSSQNIKPSIYTSMLTKCESLGILPAKIGVIKYQGSVKEVHLENARYGDKYIEALTEGIKEMNVTSCHFSSNRITQESAALLLPSLSKNLSSLKLSNNEIGIKGIQSFHRLLQGGSRLQELDLSNNKITDIGISKLCATLQNHNTIRILNLSRNNITCKSCPLLATLIQNNSFEEIYLQWNQIHSTGGKALLESLVTNSTLKVFDISWNLIGSNRDQIAAPQINQKVNGRQSITAPVTVASLLCRMLIENTEIIHVDFSSNSFNKEDCMKIAETLRSLAVPHQSVIPDRLMTNLSDVSAVTHNSSQNANPSSDYRNRASSRSDQSPITQIKAPPAQKSNRTNLIGFHFKGNFGYMDGNGFLVLTEDMLARDYRQSLLAKNIEGCAPHMNNSKNNFFVRNDKRKSSQRLRSQQARNPNTLNAYVARDVCWICEGWIEHTFCLDLTQKQTLEETQCQDSIKQNTEIKYVWIHFSFEEFKGRYVGCFESEKDIKYVGIVPPRRFEFFFTVNFIPTISPLYPQVTQFDNNFFSALEIGNQTIECYVEDRNIWEITTPSSIVDASYKPTITCRPRTIPESPPPDISFKSINPSNFQALIVPDAPQTPQELEQEFSRDWSYLKINSLMSSEEIFEVRNILLENYSNIKDLFRYYACWNSSVNLYFLDVSALHRFIKDYEGIFFEPESYNKLTKDIIFTEMKNVINESAQSWDDNELIPKNGLVRFRFIQLLIRILPHKYSPSNNLFSEGLRNLLGSIFQTKRFEDKVMVHAQWLNKFYIQMFEECNQSLKPESVFRKFRNSLQRIFLRNCSSNWKVGERKYLLFQDFKKLITTKAGTTYNSTPSKEFDLKACFFYSKTGVQDFYYDETHNRLYFAEFIQALARFAWIQQRNSATGSQLNQITAEESAQKTVEKYLSKLNNFIRVILSE